MLLLSFRSNGWITNACVSHSGNRTAIDGHGTVTTIHSIPAYTASTTFPTAIWPDADARVSRAAATVTVLGTDDAIDDAITGSAASGFPSATTALPCRRGTSAHIHNPRTTTGGIPPDVRTSPADHAQSLLPDVNAAASAAKSTVSDCNAAAYHAVSCTFSMETFAADVTVEPTSTASKSHSPFPPHALHAQQHTTLRYTHTHKHKHTQTHTHAHTHAHRNHLCIAINNHTDDSWALPGQIELRSVVFTSPSHS